MSASPRNLDQAVPGAVFITGVSSGVGQALALQLLKEGNLVLGTVRKKSDGQTLSDAGGIPILWDVTDHKRLPSVVRQVKAYLGRRPLTALINNAGLSVCAAWEHMSLQEIRYQFEVNFFSVVALTQAFLPLLKPGPGRILLMSSISARLPLGLMGAYCASKIALEAFAITLRQELYTDRIPVICIQLGTTQTRIFDRTRNDLQRLHPREMARGDYDRFCQLSHKIEQDGLLPEVAARKILKILKKPKPPLRALVSKMFWFDFLAPKVPQRFIDFLVNRVYQIYEKSPGPQVKK